jgi:hypothetical protein
MSGIKTIEGDFKPTKARYALLVARWNSFVVESLKDGAIDTLRRHGVADAQITIVRAPVLSSCHWWHRNWLLPKSLMRSLHSVQ